jgi:hypothetical protein
MKINANKQEPIKPGWYVVEYGEFNAGPAMIYYNERGWQLSPGIESFFGSHVADVWWDKFEDSDYKQFLLRILA